MPKRNLKDNITIVVLQGMYPNAYTPICRNFLYVIERKKIKFTCFFVSAISDVKGVKQIAKVFGIFWSFLPKEVYKTLIPLKSFQKDLSIGILVFGIIRLRVAVIVKSV